ncbi:unnamed protein product [Moneuplotes crassus]|uniref:Uncharacterized protein n=1 Tax=Euplotes crassus TaxID=5936 RepID=A0AAD1UM67_EUPCR|nr:unnamed protein product [Moneuplotes crassus]
MGGCIPNRSTKPTVPIQSIIQRNNVDSNLKPSEAMEAAKTSLYCIVCYKHPQKVKVTTCCNIIICKGCSKFLDRCPHRCQHGKKFLQNDKRLDSLLKIPDSPTKSVHTNL